MKSVFLVGAPRSGTTWLQLLLGQHPGIATAQETHLVDWYMGKLDAAWEREGQVEIVRRVGLHGLISEQDFENVLRHFAGTVLGAILARKPGAGVVLEKTPAHVEHWRLIHRVLPDARFVHLIRDPRAVVASLKRVANTWGGDWAPKAAVDGARMWATAVSQREAMRGALGDAYVEVKYEDLRGDPVGCLSDLYRWLGLEADVEGARAAVAACHPDRLLDREGAAPMPWSIDDEPQGFYRDAPVDDWRAELRARDIRIVEYVNRSAMEDLAYEPLGTKHRRKPWELILRDAAAESLAQIARFAKKRSPWMIRVAERAVK